MSKLKKNRSNKYTTGLCDSFTDTKQSRLFFFELDKEHRFKVPAIIDIYRVYHLDLLLHKTGNGFHFLSPTPIFKPLHRMLHKSMKDLNPKCPMTTLRTQPNKYPNEDQYWYNFNDLHHKENYIYNCKEICTYLNHVWGSDFEGHVNHDIQIVHYPLPL